MWSSRETIEATMSDVLDKKSVILDCTKVFAQTPSSLANTSLLYSGYKISDDT